MNTVTINGDQRALADANAHWVNSQVNRRKDDGQVVCVQVRIDRQGCNLVLATPTCSGSGGGGFGPPPNGLENEVIDLWRKMHLNTVDFSGGNLQAFLTQLRNLL